MLSGFFRDPTGTLLSILLTLPGVLIALSFHEYAHALAATKMGDDTPRLTGRLTLSPFAHFDLIGLVMLIFLGFGYGKPVQVNPSRFKNRFWGEILVSISGVLMNFILAFFFTFVSVFCIKVLHFTNIYYFTVIKGIVSTNLAVMVFNILPLPPLDGYRVVKRIFLGNVKYDFFWKVEQYGFLFVLILIATGILTPFLSSCVNGIYGFMLNCAWGVI